MDKKEHGQPPLPIDHEDDRELFDEQFGVASATECTGMLAFAPRTSEECAQYSEIYDVPLPGETAAENSRITPQEGKKAPDGERPGAKR